MSMTRPLGRAGAAAWREWFKPPQGCRQALAAPSRAGRSMSGSRLLRAALLLLLVAAAIGGVAGGGGAVPHVHTAAELKATIQKKAVMLVNFHAPWWALYCASLRRPCHFGRQRHQLSVFLSVTAGAASQSC